MWSKLLYCKGIGKADKYGLHSTHEARLYSADHRYSRTLPFSGPSTLASGTHPTSRRTVITTTTDPPTMDIFSSWGKHERRVELPYRPWAPHAVAVVGDDVIVVLGSQRGETKLHLHNWDGKELCALSREELGVKEESMCCIGPGGEGRLQVAAGEWVEEVSALYVYEIK